MRHSLPMSILSCCFFLSMILLAGCDQSSTPSSGMSASGAPPENSVESGDPTTLVGSDRPRIVAFGDSLTAGLGVATADSYPTQLQRRLDEEGFRYRVINAGVSGDTTAGGLRRVNWVLSSEPSIVVLELGGNDGLRGLRLEETRSNLEEIIRRLQDRKVTIVLAGMKLPPNYGADYTTRFESLYGELAGRYRVALIPFFLEGVAARPTLNQADGIHPTAQGYRVVTGNVFSTLVPLLKKAS